MPLYLSLYATKISISCFEMYVSCFEMAVSCFEMYVSYFETEISSGKIHNFIWLRGEINRGTKSPLCGSHALVMLLLRSSFSSVGSIRHSSRELVSAFVYATFLLRFVVRLVAPSFPAEGNTACGSSIMSLRCALIRACLQTDETPAGKLGPTI